MDKRYYPKNKAGLNEKQREYHRKRENEFLNTYKKGKSCAFCGYNKYPEILQFHHKDRKDKSFNIANKVRSASALNKVKAEIDKCILLSPNCHTWLHFNENKIK